MARSAAAKPSRGRGTLPVPHRLSRAFPASSTDRSKSAGEFAAPRAPCVHLMASARNGALYAGVTSNLSQRVHHHREGLLDGFTRRYHCHRLVFYEFHERMDEAIAREKQIKGGSRAKKMALIEAVNPQWRDLYEDPVKPTGQQFDSHGRDR
jgi:putative endonuclease